jgi:cell division protein FtsQ
VPVAFIKTATGLALIDSQGVVLERPARANFTFPIVTGFSERDPLEARRDRMRVYLALIEDLDRDGGHYSLDISEVDLSDPEDARILVAGRDAHDAVLVHLGNSNFLPRYRTYLAHIAQWRQQFKKIQSVDLRYERQIIVNPDRR